MNNVTDRDELTRHNCSMISLSPRCAENLLTPYNLHPDKFSRLKKTRSGLVGPSPVLGMIEEGDDRTRRQTSLRDVQTVQPGSWWKVSVDICPLCARP